ncbi:MAG: choice-of-anchor B family protein [Gemmatimonadales bacterium]
MRLTSLRWHPIAGALVLGCLAALPAAAGPGDPVRERSQFGQSVAMVGDVVYVSEPAAGTSGGVVRLYRRGPTGWKVIETVKSPIGSPSDGFGYAMAVDGKSMLVTAINGQVGKGGTVTTYARNASGGWASTGTLNSTDPSVNHFFGAAIALKGDEAAVGATREGAGTVHLYKRGADGTWQETATLKPPEAKALNHRFGSTISWQGDWIAVGAGSRDSTIGTAYLYHRGSNGQWGAAMPVTTASLGAEPSFGQAILLEKDELFVGAPGANHNAGAVMVFRRDATNQWKPTMALSPFGTAPAFGGNVATFGTAMVMVGNELWVGAPSAGQRGGVYRLERRGTEWIGSSRLAIDSVSASAGLGSAFAVSGSVAAISMPFDGGTGTVVFMGKSATGNWTTTGRAFIPKTEFTAVTGGEVQCGAGKAKEFACGNASLLSFLPISKLGGARGTQMNDNWGWTDSLSGKEYALLGRTDGTAFVDVSNPSNPRYLGNLPLTEGANPAAWRDIKTYKGYAFIVSDGAGPHGMQVFDLKRLRTVTTPQTFTADYIYRNINSAHNIVINEQSGFAYAVGASSGGETCGGGLHMIDIREPLSPKFAGCFQDTQTGINKTGYSHDAQCVTYHGPDTRYTGKEICIGSNETGISVADVTDKSHTVAIAHSAYPDVQYAHQGWFTDDHRYFYLDDEGDETNAAADTTGKLEAAKGTRTMIWDMSKLDDPVLAGTYVGTTKSIDHNLYVKGNRLYEANYSSGLRIMDISDPKKPREVGFFDTYPADDAVQFTGAWSTYPYFKSGTIIITSIGEGVFFVRDRTQTVP